MIDPLSVALGILATIGVGVAGLIAVGIHRVRQARRHEDLIRELAKSGAIITVRTSGNEEPGLAEGIDFDPDDFVN